MEIVTSLVCLQNANIKTGYTKFRQARFTVMRQRAKNDMELNCYNIQNINAHQMSMEILNGNYSAKIQI